jgi:acrylyl-CoA reductase (NADPH)
VFPFILRDVNLLGVDSVELPLVDKGHIWRRFAAEWALPQTLNSVHEITLGELSEVLTKLLKGESQGRYLVSLV